MSDLHARLRKLLALADDSDSPESRTARRLYHALLARHGIEHVDIADERVGEAEIEISPGTRPILAAICASLGIESWGFRRVPAKRGRKTIWRRRPYILCTNRQFEAVRALYEFSATLYLRRRRQSQAELRGYLYGHLRGHYPSERRPICPRCGSTDFGYDADLGRWRCGRCRRRMARPIEVDRETYDAAVREAARPAIASPPTRRVAGGSA